MTAGAGLALKVFKALFGAGPLRRVARDQRQQLRLPLRIGDNQAPQAVHPEAVRIVDLPNFHHHIGEGLAIGNPVQRVLFQRQRVIVAITQGKPRCVLGGIGPKAFWWLTPCMANAASLAQSSV